MELAELQRETRSSIELERTAKGEYKWTIKVYYEKDAYGDALIDIKDIDAELRTHFLPGGA